MDTNNLILYKEEALIVKEDASTWSKNLAKVRLYENKIKEKLSNMQNDFLSIGLLLLEMEKESIINGTWVNNKYCTNVVDFALMAFGFAKANTYNLMAVARTFATAKGLKAKYKGYGFTQLVRLLPLPERLHKYFSPLMTIKEIESIKKGDTVWLYSKNELDWNTSSKSYKIPEEELKLLKDEKEKVEEKKEVEVNFTATKTEGFEELNEEKFIQHMIKIPKELFDNLTKFLKKFKGERDFDEFMVEAIEDKLEAEEWTKN